MVISSFLSVFFDGLEAEKGNVGLRRTDSRHAAGAENSRHLLFNKLVTPSADVLTLECTRTLDQDTKNVCNKDGLLCNVSSVKYMNCKEQNVVLQTTARLLMRRMCYYQC